LGQSGPLVVNSPTQIDSFIYRFVKLLYL